jgi:uncharacterized protein (DUF1684 family)
MASYENEVQKERDMKDEFMSRHPESPFRVGDAEGFHGLAYYPIDESYRVPATLERVEKPREAALRTNQEGQLTCRYIGDLVFELEGQPLRLRVFHAGEQVGPSVFVPFRDKTCGEGSYEAGRYLILQLTEDDRYTLDFNLAFNPYCAYTERYECGLPPAENDLPVSISAGEMAYIAGPPPEFVEAPPPEEREPTPRRALEPKRSSPPEEKAGAAAKASAKAKPAKVAVRSKKSR